MEVFWVDWDTPAPGLYREFAPAVDLYRNFGRAVEFVTEVFPHRATTIGAAK